MLLVFRSEPIFFDYLSTSNISDDQTHASMTVEKWISTLKLADMWGFDKAKTLAIEMIKASKVIDDPIQKWLLGERYNVPLWAIDGCVKLAMHKGGPQLEEVEKLGLPKALLVYKLRELRFRLIINTMAQQRSHRAGLDAYDFQIRLRILEEAQKALGGGVSEAEATTS